jgi:hypothetical protein
MMEDISVFILKVHFELHLLSLVIQTLQFKELLVLVLEREER